LNHLTDFGDGDAGDLPGYAGRGGGGKEQFVVFTPVQGLGQSCPGVEREGGCIDLGGEFGFFAEVGKVCREAVAQVKGCRGLVVALEPEALGDARLRIEVGGQQGFEPLGNERSLASVFGVRQFSQTVQAGGSTAQGAGYVEQVTGAGAGTEQGLAPWSCADEDDVSDGDGGLGQVTARQRGFVGLGQGEEAIEETVDPGGTVAPGNSQLAR
jgi:hypothetical protein